MRTAFAAVRPHQHDNAVRKPAQALETLLAVRLPCVLNGQHGRLENGFALREINSMFAKVDLALCIIVRGHKQIVYAI